MKHMTLLILFQFYLVVYGKSEPLNPNENVKNPTKLSSCKAKLDDGRMFDLTSLDDTVHPRKASNDDYDYLFNPCSPIKCKKGAAANAAVCQVSKNDQSQTFDLGDQSTASFSLEGDVMQITYRFLRKTSILSCLCGNDESFRVSEDQQEVYNLYFTSPCCCYDTKCDGKRPKNKQNRLSLGSVLLIIFFALFVGYFVVGFLYMKLVRKASGMEAVPNRQFWNSLPSNIKMGVLFVQAKFKGSNQYSNIK